MNVITQEVDQRERLDPLTLAILKAAIEQNPSDTLSYLIAADLLEEEGNYKLAVAYRYCGQNKQYPIHHDDIFKDEGGSNNRWGWLRNQKVCSSPNSMLIHETLNDWFDDRSKKGWVRHSFSEIMSALADAIEENGL